MICSVAFLKRRDAAPVLANETQLLQDVLWAHSPTDYGLQHVRVKEEADGMRVHLFFRGTDLGRVTRLTDRLMDDVGKSSVMGTYHQPSHSPSTA